MSVLKERIRQARSYHRHKCRCGAWLFGKRIAMGYCERCGPEDVTQGMADGEATLRGHALWCAALIGRECNCQGE